MVGKFLFKGREIEDLQKMDMKELSKLLNARARRSVLRGFNPEQKKLLSKIEIANKQRAQSREPTIIKTHCRDMLILPSMVGLKFGVHNGREFMPVEIKAEMIGHYLGEFAATRKKITHGTPGMGATKGKTVQASEPHNDSKR